VIEKCIVEADDTIAEIAKVLGAEDEAVNGIRNARDWLRGLRDTGVWNANHVTGPETITTEDLTVAHLQRELSDSRTALAELMATMDGKIAEARHAMELEFEKRKRELRRQNAAASRIALVAKIAEHMAPLLRGFKYNPKDARHIGELVDYIVYDGLEDGEIRNVVFLEVKTKRGAARVTNPREKLLMDAINAGRVSYEVFVPDVNDAKGTTKRRVKG
jgi:predicted Holliday junction resolvase-like endonuclease